MSQCSATAKSTGAQCGRDANRGTSVCYVHGAAAGQVKRAAKRRQDEERARAMVGALLHDTDAEPIADPFAELLRLGGVLRNAANVAGERLNALDSIRNLDDKGAEQLRSEAVLWREIVTLAQRTLVDIARLDIEGRHLRLEEAKVVLVAAALDTALRAGALDQTQRYQVRQAFAAALDAS